MLKKKLKQTKLQKKNIYIDIIKNLKKLIKFQLSNSIKQMSKNLYKNPIKIKKFYKKNG